MKQKNGSGARYGKNRPGIKGFRTSTFKCAGREREKNPRLLDEDFCLTIGDTEGF